MRVAPSLCLAFLLLACGAPASAHGQTIQREQVAGAYHVTFFTYDLITENEFVRVGWNVTVRDTREQVRLDNPSVSILRYDEHGQLVESTAEQPQQPQPGFLFLDTQVGPKGVTNFTLPLPEGSVAFSQLVCAYDDQGAVRCPGDAPRPQEPARPSPGPDAAMLLVALAFLAAGLTRPARRA